MGRAFGGFAKRVYEALASPYALIVSLGLVAAYFIVGPRIGLPPQPLELSFFLTLATFILVFLVEHEGYRDNAATQVKLDEIIRALGADRSKIGIEDRPPREIESVRDKTRAQEGQDSPPQGRAGRDGGAAGGTTT
jgi:low affinity Fe/Cu permease